MPDLQSVTPPGGFKDPTFGKAQILLTVTPDLKRLIQERAGKAGMSMGAYARRVLGVHLGLLQPAPQPTQEAAP